MLVCLCVIGAVALVALTLVGVLAAFSLFYRDDDNSYPDEIDDFNV